MPARAIEMPAMDTRPIPAGSAGIGLRSQHHDEFLRTFPDVAWVEVHSENFFAAGGPPQAVIAEVAQRYPVSLHGVGLSLGSVDPLNAEHLSQLRSLVERIRPALVSEHVSWSSVDGIFLNDLLPLPYTHEALAHIVGRIGQVQDFLRRRILIENVSSYLEYQAADFSEAEFVAEVARRAGCGILLDVNNVFVSAANHGGDARAYLQAVPVDLVAEMHLAGHTRTTIADQPLLIDTHSAPVAPAVWELYRFALQRFGPVPTLVEWDADLPPLARLIEEASFAGRMLEAIRVRVA